MPAISENLVNAQYFYGLLSYGWNYFEVKVAHGIVNIWYFFSCACTRKQFCMSRINLFGNNANLFVNGTYNILVTDTHEDDDQLFCFRCFYYTILVMKPLFVREGVGWHRTKMSRKYRRPLTGHRQPSLYEKTNAW